MVHARFGERMPLAVGAAVAALGFALLAIPDSESGYWSGFFPGIAVAPLTIVVMAAVPENRAGLASGVNNSASRVAMLPMTLQMAMHAAPLRCASRSAANVSAVSPDCVMTTASVVGVTIGFR